MRVVNIHRRDGNNAGDMASPPLRYFGFPGVDVSFHDIGILSNPERVMQFDAVVVGGGGLLYDKGGWVEALERLPAHHRNTIFWGAGLNSIEDIQYPPWVSRFSLVGARDWRGLGHEWVPCPSCMNPLLDKPRVIERDVVIYDHPLYPVPVNGIVRLDLTCPDLGYILDFLGSGETVLTSSYHGAYWATLMRRRVVLFAHTANRFNYLKYKVPTVQRGEVVDWREKAGAAVLYQDALIECRNANIRFAQKVRSFLEKNCEG